MPRLWPCINLLWIITFLTSIDPIPEHLSYTPGLGKCNRRGLMGAPPRLLHYVNQTHALYEKMVILSVLTMAVPEIKDSMRVEVTELGHGVYKVTTNCGFIEAPDIPQALAAQPQSGLPLRCSGSAGWCLATPSSRYYSLQR